MFLPDKGNFQDRRHAIRQFQDSFLGTVRYLWRLQLQVAPSFNLCAANEGGVFLEDTILLKILVVSFVAAILLRLSEVLPAE